MDRPSKHRSSEERGVIFAEHDRGSSQRAIGQLLRRPASTIGRELARGRQDDGSRPEEIEARLIPGHWEGDLIKGAFSRSSVGTLALRKTRFVVLCKMNGNGAGAVLDNFTCQ